MRVTKILVVTLSNLGDVVLTLPVFQSLLEAYPNAVMDVIVGESGACVFEADARIRKLTVYRKKARFSEKLGILRAVRRERYDLIIDLRRSLFGFLGGAARRNSYLRFPRKSLHRSLYHLDSLKGIVRAPFPLSSFLGDTHRIQNLNSVSVTGDSSDPRPWVLAAVGSKSDIKKWPAASYAQLLDRLIAERGCRVTLIGDARDAEDARRVRDAMEHPVEDLCGRTDFRALVRVISGAALLVTNDSAPLHVADALGVPVLAIFGPTDARKYGPRNGSSLVARRGLFCSPCEKAQCRFKHECMNEMSAAEVHAKALQILNDEHKPRQLKILVVRLDRIGDTALSFPSIAAIRHRFPNAHISAMVRPYTQELLENNPHVDEVIPYFYENKGRHAGLLGATRFLKEVVRRHFDIAFILHPGLRSHLVPFLAGIPYRIGFRRAWPFLLTKAVPDRRHQGLKHESEYALDVVRAFGVEPPAGVSGGLQVPSGARRKIEKVLAGAGWGEGTPVLAIHAGASCPSKRWPKENFARLSRRVLEDPDFRVAIVGGSDEKLLGSFLSAQLGKRAMDLTGRLSLLELAAFFEKCRALVSNDSGPVHVASLVGLRSVVIYGRNQAGLSVRRWKPLGPAHRTLQKDVGCVVCLAHRCTIDFECLKAVSVEEVYEAFKEI